MNSRAQSSYKYNERTTHPIDGEKLGEKCAHAENYLKRAADALFERQGGESTQNKAITALLLMVLEKLDELEAKINNLKE